MQQISTDFRRRRLQLGLTQADLADRCTELGAPVDESNVGRIERSQQVPRPALRAVLAQVLNLDVDYFDTPTADTSEDGAA